MKAVGEDVVDDAGCYWDRRSGEEARGGRIYHPNIKSSSQLLDSSSFDVWKSTFLDVPHA